MSEITVHVLTESGEKHSLEAPTDMGLSLMELLKANDFEVMATCGGMALCATCHVEILAHTDPLPLPNDAELDMLDTLPSLTQHSRLSCQLRLQESLDGLVFRIVG
ncbi:MAG: 2Fe-2S iron-sulfur cluster binding domain-containing protein [Verrucomicrobia bacterium]|nr:2Fe-2S iron-sulfur cluster binding domain-containing protein [Cytophagales bacterium]